MRLMAVCAVLGMGLVGFSQDEPVKQAPRRLGAGDHGIGRRIADMDLTDLEARRLKLSDVAARSPLVIALVSSSCPIGRRFLPTLARMEEAYGKKGVKFLFVAPIPSDTPDQLKQMTLEAGLKSPLVRDPGLPLARALGAQTTTDAFILDSVQTLVYRGAVSDQYGLGYSLDAPKETYLSDALDAVLASRALRVAATWAPGCALDLSPSLPVPSTVTYHNRISRILQKACIECHRKGGAAPFSLESVRDLAAHKGMIRKVVERGTMPPWFAAPPPEGEASPWANDRSLSKSEKQDLLGWIAAGLPEGNNKDAPLPRKFPEGWTIGPPDAVFELPREVEVKAEGRMDYVDLEVETNFPQDRWVTKIEVRPTSGEVVHHALVFVLERDKPGEKPEEAFWRKLSEYAGFFAVYVPGLNSLVYPDGYAKRLPAGAKLHFQMHYTPKGTATRDRTRLGLVFSKSPPRRMVRTIGVSNVFLSIPPGAENHPVKGSVPVPTDVEILSFFPHMHVRGKAFRYEVVLPGGSRETLLDVPRYDFNWQLAYHYFQPRLIPRGSTVEVTGWYDNSKNNPANPDPTRTVRWGLQTVDEMMLGYADYVIPSEKIPGSVETPEER